MTSPLLNILRIKFSSASITLLAQEAITSVFIHDENIDDTISANPDQDLDGGYNLVSTLLKNRFDLIIDLTPRWWTLVYALFACPFARRLERDGYSTYDRYQRNLLALKGKSPRLYKREHDVIRNIRPLEDFMDIYNLNPETYFPEPPFIEDEFEKLKEIHGLRKKEYIVIVPGSQWEVRRWNIERFAESARIIAREFGLNVVVTGVKSETGLGRKFMNLVEGNAVNLTGELSIEQFLSVIKHSCLLIGNDSGPAHVAAAMNIPVIAVMGTADVDVYKPWGEKVRVLYRDVLCGPCYSGKCYMPRNICLQPVTPEEVVNAARELLINQKSEMPK